MTRPATSRPSMTLQERSELVLAFARVLFVNGQATDQTGIAAERLAAVLGLQARLMLRWGELQLRAEGKRVRLVAAVAAVPTGIDMGRVTSTMRVIDALAAGELAPARAGEAISAI